MENTQFQSFIDEAAYYAQSVAINIRPIPMHVMSNGKLINIVESGACGNSMIQIKINNKFGKWCLANGYAYKCIKGGVITGGLRTQSYDINRAYANAYSESLRKNGIVSTVVSYMD